MTQDERHDALTEARMFTLAAPVILPLLEKRKRFALGRLEQKFREGSTDFIALAAELTLLADLEREIRQKENIFNTLNGESR